MKRHRYKYNFVEIDGEWLELDDAYNRYGELGVADKGGDTFEIEVEAKDWKDAKEKLILAATILSNPFR